MCTEVVLTVSSKIGNEVGKNGEPVCGKQVQEETFGWDALFLK